MTREPAPPPARPMTVKPMTFVLLVLLLAACGSRTGSGSGAAPDDPPTRIPAAPGQVQTRGAVTVLDDGSGAELCLGGVAESYPPQCGGPPLVGWDWQQQRLVLGQPGGGDTGYEQARGVRWGQFFLVGGWDGTSFTVTTSVAEARYEGSPVQPDLPPPPEPPVDAAELERIERELMAVVPGALTSYSEAGRAYVDVVYDDGSLQRWADERYGRGVVVVGSTLLDVPDSGG